MAQIQYPGSAFQYICNIADAGFLGTLSGKQWQKDYLSGKANVSDTEGMMDSMEYIQKWKDIGMLDSSNSDPTDGKIIVFIGTTEWNYGLRRYNGQIWSDAIPV